MILFDSVDREQVIAYSLRRAPQAKKAWPVSLPSQEDISDAVSAIAVPTLVIACELDRGDSVEATKSELMPRTPGAVLRVLPGTGHLSPLESTGDLIRLIHQFAEGPA